MISSRGGLGTNLHLRLFVIALASALMAAAIVDYLPWRGGEWATVLFSRGVGNGVLGILGVARNPGTYEFSVQLNGLRGQGPDMLTFSITFAAILWPLLFGRSWWTTLSAMSFIILLGALCAQLPWAHCNEDIGGGRFFAWWMPLVIHGIRRALADRSGALHALILGIVPSTVVYIFADVLPFLLWTYVIGMWISAFVEGLILAI